MSVVAHHRARARRAEERAAALAAQRDRLEQLLALALQVAAGDDCDPIVLLRVLEEIIDGVDARKAELDRAAALLRATDPDRLTGPLRAA